METHFLAPERLPAADILRQQDQAVRCPVLVAMLDTAPQMLALINPERQIVLCNEACVKAAGMKGKEDILGLRPGEVLKCIHVSEMPGGCGTAEPCRYCGLAQALVEGQKGNRVQSECLLECEGPSASLPREFAVNVTPMPELGPGWQCYSLTDVSHEKRRQALERTFFHDVLNRVAAVDGVSAVLLSGNVSAQERERFLHILSVSSQALVEEIRAQRNLLAAEQGELAVSRESCECDRVLAESVGLCQASGFAEGKEILLSPQTERVSFTTDPVLLGRVLVNLLKNALEASGPGEKVTASAARSGACVRFSVHNGRCMPEAVQAHVFQRCFSTKGAGRGLGTYSAKLITEGYLHGRVWFESGGETGTTFHVELPL